MPTEYIHVYMPRRVLRTNCAYCEALTGVLQKIEVIRDIALFRWVNSSRILRNVGTYKTAQHTRRLESSQLISLTRINRGVSGDSSHMGY
jgi:hypothetical protein